MLHVLAPDREIIQSQVGERVVEVHLESGGPGSQLGQVTVVVQRGAHEQSVVTAGSAGRTLQGRTQEELQSARERRYTVR